MTALADSAPPPREGVGGRLSDLLWRRPGVMLALLLAPPLLWLGIVYLGSLFALLLQSFFSIDEFSGVIDRTLTLKTYGELTRPANLDIIWRTVVMAALVTVAPSSGAACVEGTAAWMGVPCTSMSSRVTGPR